MTRRTQTRPRRLNRAEKREANRERILRAARKVFGARGFHAATVEQIADEAGLSNGAIYYNFDSKGDLFFALLEERQEERIHHLRRTLTSASGPGSRGVGLEEEARDATRSLKESREWRLLLFEFVAHATRTAQAQVQGRTRRGADGACGRRRGGARDCPRSAFARGDCACQRARVRGGRGSGIGPRGADGGPARATDGHGHRRKEGLMWRTDPGRAGG